MWNRKQYGVAAERSWHIKRCWRQRLTMGNQSYEGQKLWMSRGRDDEREEIKPIQINRKAIRLREMEWTSDPPTPKSYFLEAERATALSILSSFYQLPPCLLYRLLSLSPLNISLFHWGPCAWAFFNQHFQRDMVVASKTAHYLMLLKS